MGFVDVAELEEKYRKSEDENRDLEDQLAALEEQGAQFSVTLRELRVQAEDLKQNLEASEQEYMQLENELQAEQASRVEMQERLEQAELEAQEMEGFSKPLFVVFPTNRGTLGRVGQARPHRILNPPSTSSPLPALPSSTPVGLLPAPPMAASVGHFLQGPAHASASPGGAIQGPGMRITGYSYRELPPQASAPYQTSFDLAGSLKRTVSIGYPQGIWMQQGYTSYAPAYAPASGYHLYS